MTNDADALLERLQNCLQTILELEPDLEQLDMGDALVKEFGMLKAFLQRLEGIDIQEDDVRRIETATASFLEELRVPLSLLDQEDQLKRQLH
jgi:hypothetical protein